MMDQVSIAGVSLTGCCFAVMLALVGCQATEHRVKGSDTSSDSDTDGDGDTDSDTVGDGDSDTEGSDPCEDGELLCIDGDAYLCDDGEWILEDDCDESIAESCFGGECYGPCEWAEGAESYIGCEYYAVCLPGAHDEYAVVLSNLNEIPAEVVIERNDAEFGDPPSISTAATVTVPPGSLETVFLPWSYPPAESGPGNTTKSFLGTTPYHVTSSIPIVVYQFAPYDNASSNDASILLPVHALGQEYVVMAWPQTQGGPSYTSVVATEDDTVVELLPTTDISESDSIGPGYVAPSEPGVERTFTLNTGDILVVSNENVVDDEWARGEDYTGTSVSASAPVAVFAGGSVVDVPHYTDPEDFFCCADHIEQQIFPEKTLGKEFVAARTPVRSFNGFVEPEYWRVLATVDGTTVNTTLDPPDDQVVLNRGEHVEFGTEGDFLVSADEPVLLGQFVSSGETTNVPIMGENGDPAFILVPPFEQFRDSYLTLTPDTYLYDFLIITVPDDGTSFTIDGLSPAVHDCESSELADAWNIVRCLVEDGVHEVQATGPVGLVVYGYQRHTSYGYSGGLDLEAINPDVE
jgi:hypothetical protein